MATNCMDPALGQHHTIVKATVIKRYKYCIKFSIDINICLEQLLHY
ncbi:rCG55705, partial [Rattus norvegicus]